MLERLNGRNILLPLKLGISGAKKLGEKAIRSTNLPVRTIGEVRSSEIEDLMALNQIPGSAHNLLYEMAETDEDSDLMEVNTARLLWLNRKHIHQLGPSTGYEDDYYVYQTVDIMLSIGIPKNRVSDLLNSGLPQAVIGQTL